MKSASNSGQDLFTQQKATGLRRVQVTRWVLGMVILLAGVAASALWFTLDQTRKLARPSQHSDVWHVSSVSNELARVSLLSHRLITGVVDRDELLLRLDVLYSQLDQSSSSPRLNIQLSQIHPETARMLNELKDVSDGWTRLLQQDLGVGSVQRVLEESQAYGDRVASAIADVHLASTLDADRQRLKLLQSFMLLSLALLLLLVGASIGIWRVLRDRSIAIETSRMLNEANQTLETRVRERTRQIDEAHNLLTFILDASPSDVALLDAESGNVHYINRRLVDSLGMRHKPQQLSLRELLHDPVVGETLERTLQESGQVDGFEALIASQTPYWSSLSARLIEVKGRLAYLVWGFDVSTHKRLENELRILATTDLLSGLNNRRAFHEKGETLLEHCRRYQVPCGALMIDIDHFKSINDRFGHPVGDEAIRAAGRAIQAALRDADLVGRIGGEEFAVLLPYADVQGVRDTAERIRQSVEALSITTGNGQLLRFTVSLGLASFRPPDQDLEQLLVQADHALYQAKAEGRNRAVTYTAEKLDL